MKNNKKGLVWMLIITFIMSFFPFIEAEASDDINVISKTNVTVSEAKTWAKKRGATETFINLADLYWKYAGSHGNVNPALAYVQAAKETGYGKFGGIINESYHNPCGLKTSKGGEDSDPNAHMKFKTWDEGVQAHLDHLALYAGANGYPRSNTYDPRHFSSIKGKAKTVLSLGGNWAPSTKYGTEVLELYRELEPLVKGGIYGNIDEPISNSTVYANTIHVRGWALNPSGISKIKVYIDDVFKGEAVTGQSRPDVANVFAGYAGASNSGFNLDVDLSNLASGNKTLKVEQIGKDGTKNIITSKFSYEKLCEIQNIDTPVNGAKIPGNILDVSGWSLSGNSIKTINVYVDGKLKGSTTPNISRPDVAKVYPRYTNAGNSGFKVRLNISDVANGTRTLKVEQVATNGTVYYNEQRINISRLNPITVIDEPNGSAVINGTSMNVRGWALNGSGVKSIKIYVDSKLLSTTTTGKSRLDVKNVYPNYNDTNSGYSANVDVSSIGGGNKVLKVEQVGEDGSVNSSENTIYINKLQSISVIDTPGSGWSINSDKLRVSGWALSDSGVKEIKVYIDGKEKGNATLGIKRQDVKNVYPKYKNADNSGFSMDVDIRDIAAGNRTIEIKEISNDGSEHTNSVTIKIVKEHPITNIDSPLGNANIKGTSLEVKGWALNRSGVKAINIYIGSTLVKTITTGQPRIDVKNVYPQFNDDKSGFSTTIDIGKFEGGPNTLRVEQVGVDGSKDVSERTINIEKLESNSVIDTPASGTKITNKEITLSGWAISNSAVKEITVSIDGKEKGKATLGLAREDVKNVYPNYPNANRSGFTIKINVNDVAPGSKEIKIKEISNDGSVHYNRVTVNIVKKNPISVVDTPSEGYVEKGNNLRVVGWALNESSVKVVNIYVDGNKRTSTKPTLIRADVTRVYPGYQSNNVCGYEASVNLAGLVSGMHKILVEAVGVDGTISSELKHIYYKEKPSKLIVVDPGHNHGGDDGAYSDDRRYCERDINMTIAIKLKTALENKGYRVVLTREPSAIERIAEKESLTKRVEIANSLKADLFISIHQNKFSPSAHGTEVYYSTNNNDSNFQACPDKNAKVEVSKSLARNVVNNIANLGFTNRGAKDGNLFVLRNTTMPAILVECGFISNSSDVAKLTNSDMQRRIGEAIANGVYNNF